jgi:hypothetical protein
VSKVLRGDNRIETQDGHGVPCPYKKAADDLERILA